MLSSDEMKLTHFVAKMKILLTLLLLVMTLQC